MGKPDSGLIRSFPPITGKNPGILILGSIPGKESLRKQEYYGHPRNHFWNIISLLTGKEHNGNYSLKTNLIIESELALWDVCMKAYRESSLDTDIKEEIPNTIIEFLELHPSVKKVIFNGKKAEELYKKHFQMISDITYLAVLSTSPANASYTFEEKLENWEEAFNL